MKAMEVGDEILFYHSGEGAGVYGTAKVSAKAHADRSQFKKSDMHYEPRATKEKPVWECVDVSFVEMFKKPVPLGRIKVDPALRGIMVATQGSRLSVQPVSKAHFAYIKTLAR
jgi:predicted RNA-binding protein with PUA-like domain